MKASVDFWSGCGSDMCFRFSKKYPMKLSKMGLEHERCLICKEDAKCRKIYIYNIGLELSDNQLFKEIIGGSGGG